MAPVEIVLPTGTTVRVARGLCPHGAPDARRDDHHRDAPALLLLRPHWCAGPVPITGNRATRILHGAINVKTGDVSLLITDEWTREMHPRLPVGDPLALAGLEYRPF